MPINYLFALGRAPGAVTSALDFIQRRLKECYSKDTSALRKAGYDFFATDPNKPPSTNRFANIILITTPEITGESDHPLEGVWRDNNYGQAPTQPNPNDPKHPIDIVSVQKGNPYQCVINFIQHNLASWAYTGNPAPRIYRAYYNRHNYRDTVRQVLSILTWLVPPGQQGRTTWVNVTAGDNIVNSAMLTASYLVGTVGRIFYTWAGDELADLQCLRLCDTTRAGHFIVDLPLLRIDLSPGLQMLLEDLERRNGPAKNDDLLAALHQQDSKVFPLEIDWFKRHYLNKLDPYILRGDKSKGDGDKNELAPAGRDLLTFLRYPELAELVAYNRNPQPATESAEEPGPTNCPVGLRSVGLLNPARAGNTS